MPDAGFKAFTATKIRDASGVLLAAGSLSVTPTDANDVPLSSIGGGGGAICYAEASTAITTPGTIGAFEVVDTEATKPPSRLRIVIRDAANNQIFKLTNVRTLNVTFNLDTYDPTAAASSAFAPASLIIADTANGLFYQLALVAGAPTWTPYVPSGSDTTYAGLTFIDAVDGSHWTLTFTNGAETWSSTHADIGVPITSLSLTDTVTAVTHTYAVLSGAPTLI